MSRVDEHPPGTPSWVDLRTHHPDDAALFYAELFDWTVHAAAPNAGGYRMCTYEDRTVAGIGLPLDLDTPPAWWTSFGVVDADASAAAIERAGGRVVVEPTDVADSGRLAAAVDPGGARFAIWQPRTHAGAAIIDETHACCWNELMTHHRDRAVDFYRRVFGWQPHRHGDEPDDYVEFHLGEESIAGLMPMVGGRAPDLADQWLVYFAVDDVDASTGRVEQLGGRVAVAPSELLLGRFAIVHDRQGAVFCVITFRDDAA